MTPCSETLARRPLLEMDDDGDDEGFVVAVNDLDDGDDDDDVGDTGEVACHNMGLAGH